MRDELSSVRIAFTDSSHEMDIPCTHLIIAAGAWSPKVFQTLFPDAKDQASNLLTGWSFSS